MGGALPERAMGQKSGRRNPITNKPLVRSLKQFILQMMDISFFFFFFKKNPMWNFMRREV